MPQNPLPFTIQPQQCSEWCWAAVVSSIASFVRSPQQPQQCEIVDNQCFDPVFAASPGCCNAENQCIPKDKPCLCNQTSSVGRALTKYNLLTGEPDGQDPTAGGFQAITQQIDQGSVVVLQVVDRSNSDLVHVVIAYGFSGSDDLKIADPADGASAHYSYTQLVSPSADAALSGWQLQRLFTTVAVSS